MAPGWTTLRAPMRVPERTTAWPSTRLPSPITTPGSMIAKGPTVTPGPSSTSGATRARGWTWADTLGSGLPVDDRGQQLALGAQGALDAGLALELPHVGAVVEDR